MNENILALVSIISIGILFVFVFWLYRDYSVDSFRQKMFSLRDSLFDEAAKGNIDFEAPAYGMLRSTMNGLIRFGHRITLPHLVFMSYAVEKHSKAIGKEPFADKLDRNLNSLPLEQRELLLNYFKKMNFILVRHLLVSSPVLLVTVLVPLFVFFAANQVVRSALRALRKPIDNLDSLALVEGEA